MASCSVPLAPQKILELLHLPRKSRLATDTNLIITGMKRKAILKSYNVIHWESQ